MAGSFIKSEYLDTDMQAGRILPEHEDSHIPAKERGLVQFQHHNL